MTAGDISDYIRAGRLHRCDKSITGTRHRLDALLAIAVVADGLAHLVNTPRQRIVSDDSMFAPYRVSQLLFGDQMVRMLDQIEKHIERLGFDVNDRSTPGQLPL